MPSSSAAARPLSGLQKEVLSLYRVVLRVAFQKDLKGGDIDDNNSSLARPSSDRIRLADLLWKEDIDTNSDQSTSTSYARDEFRRQAMAVDRTDFRTIEHKIRQGHKQVKLLQMPGVKVVNSSSATASSAAASRK